MNDEPKVSPPAVNAQAPSTTTTAPVAPAVTTPAASDVAALSFNEILEREHQDAQTRDFSTPAVEAQAELPLVEDAPAAGEPQAAAAGAPVETPATEVPAQQAAAPVEGAAPAAAVEQPAPVKREYKAEDVIEIGDGWQVARGELQAYLEKVPQDFQALNQTAHGYYQRDQQWQKIFGMPVEQAAKDWAPLMQALNTDPDFAQYVNDALTHYFTETGKPAPGAQPQLDPAIRAAQEASRKVDDFVRNQQSQQMISYVRAEQNALVTKFPKLADPRLWDIVTKHAYAKLFDNPQYTLTQAAHDLASYLNLADAPPAAPAVTPAPEIPALVTSNGAAPNGSRKVIQLAEASNTSEATAQWERERRALGYN